MIFGQNLAIYTVFYKESESEVKKSEILDPGGKKNRKTNVKSCFSIFFICFFYLNLGLKRALFLGQYFLKGGIWGMFMVVFWGMCWGYSGG